MYISRTIERAIERTGHGFPVLLLTGPRQSGKTTVLRHLSADRRYVSLDDPTLRELARTDPRLFLQRFAAPVLIDEIQYAPELLPYIKLAVDNDRQPGCYWLTGSQQFQIMAGVTETLAGRVGILNLLGFSLRERRKEGLDAEPFLPSDARTGPAYDLHQTFDAIWRGSLPALIAESPEPELFHSSYLQTYLQRDVRDLTRLGDLETFTRFVRACAARTAQLLNLSDLARDVDISVPTAKSWLSVLTASYQVLLVQPYHTNVTKRLVKTPKLYFLDTGLASHLTGWTSPEALAGGAMAGPMFETFVVAEIIKSWWHNGRTAPITFYRDRDKREIDLLLDVDGKLHPVEIKMAATPRRQWANVPRPLERLGRPLGRGAVISLAPETTPLSPHLSALPLGSL